MPKLEEEYIKPGTLKYVFRDLPLEQIHKFAFRAAEAAHCAGEQGQYWPMHDLLFANYRNLSEENFRAYAQQISLNVSQFEQCMAERKFKVEVEKDLQDAQQLSINGTPTFLIGLTQPGTDQITILRSLRGAQPYEQFKEAIEAVLKGQ